MSTFKAGVDAAAKHLIGTASDYEQIAAQLQTGYEAALRIKAFGASNIKLQINAALDKAKLLRGQAEHIQQLQPGPDNARNN